MATPVWSAPDAVAQAPLLATGSKAEETDGLPAPGVIVCFAGPSKRISPGESASQDGAE